MMMPTYGVVLRSAVPIGFRYLLVLGNGEPADPAVFPRVSTFAV